MTFITSKCHGPNGAKLSHTGWGGGGEKVSFRRRQIRVDLAQREREMKEVYPWCEGSGKGELALPLP